MLYYIISYYISHIYRSGERKLTPIGFGFLCAISKKDYSLNLRGKVMGT